MNLEATPGFPWGSGHRVHMWDGTIRVVRRAGFQYGDRDDVPGQWETIHEEPYADPAAGKARRRELYDQYCKRPVPGSGGDVQFVKDPRPARPVGQQTLF